MKSILEVIDDVGGSEGRLPLINSFYYWSFSLAYN